MKQQEDNILLEAAKKGGKFVGSVLFLPVRATIYLKRLKKHISQCQRGIKYHTRVIIIPFSNIKLLGRRWCCTLYCAPNTVSFTGPTILSI